MAQHPVADSLASYAGAWTGTSEVYFRPGELADSSEIQGTIRVLPDGKHIDFDYTWTFKQTRQAGRLTLTYDANLKQWLMSWIDTFHNAERILALQSKRGADANHATASGMYPADATVDWGWRIEVLPKGSDTLSIQHFNIPPGIEGVLGVDWLLTLD